MKQATTSGQRIYLVRLARGDGIRDAEPIRDFAAALSKARGKNYDPSTVSRLERGDQRPSLDDCEAVAKLDPAQRGAAWIAFGTEKGSIFEMNPATAHRLTDEEIEAARRVVVEDEGRAARAAGKHQPKGKKRA